MEADQIHILQGTECITRMPSDYIDKNIADACLKTCSGVYDESHTTFDTLVDSSSDDAIVRGNANLIKGLLNLPFVQFVGKCSYRFGRYFGKEAYYCMNPTEGFYNRHKKNVLMITPNEASVPHDWAEVNGCRAVTPAEMFYQKADGQIGVSDVLSDLKDNKKPSAILRQSYHRRGKEWGLMLVTILFYDYDPSDYRDGLLTKSAAVKWYRKANKNCRLSDKTIGRDLDYFIACASGKKIGESRLNCLIGKLVLRTGNPKFTPKQRIQASERIKAVLVEMEKPQGSDAYAMAEFPDIETGFVTGADGQRECVPTASAESVYDSLD